MIFKCHGKFSLTLNKDELHLIATCNSIYLKRSCPMNQQCENQGIVLALHKKVV